MSEGTDPPPDPPTPPGDAPEDPVAEAPTTVEVVEGGEEVGRLPLPRRDRGEIFGVASQLMGAARIRVMCEDNIPRMGRITGKMKKKMWVREGDLLILRPWGFQEGKCDILFRYSRTQSTYLARRDLLPASVNVFGEADASKSTPAS
ncbi:MAG TPA: translation initiation factor eIF-1A [Thermoplasmata archaeon]|nr:translation initiation factor eIF-1A [Thermoplasmata archaeon]